MSKTKYYVVWIEGLSAKNGEKIKNLVPNPGTVRHYVEYTTYMTKALRVKEADRARVRHLLEECGVVSSFIIFVPTSYAPAGTIFEVDKKKAKKNRDAWLDDIDDEKIESVILRSEITSRGGGIEISVSELGFQSMGVKMTAYQNYLGGGLLGKIESSCNLSNWRDIPSLVKLSEKLKQYFHSITNPDSEWESKTFEQNQKMPTSAY